MTHTAEPMTFAQLSADIGQYDSGTVGTRRLRKWKAAIGAELAKQRETVPVAWMYKKPNWTNWFYKEWCSDSFGEDASEFIRIPLYTHPQQHNAVEVTQEILRTAEISYDDAALRFGCAACVREPMRAALSAVASRRSGGCRMKDYAEIFDSIMSDIFPGEIFKTEWNILLGSYGGWQTKRLGLRRKRVKGDLVQADLTKEQAMVGRAISLAIEAARWGNNP